MMDDKIIEEMDNLDVQDADQLLHSIDTATLDEELDVETQNRIKTSVLQKAGIGKKSPKPLIPYKRRFFLGSLALAFIELLFFTSSAFVAWMDAFLVTSGLNLSLGGMIPFLLYGILFVFMCLFVSLAMYHMDSDRLRLDKLFPRNRTSLAYLFYFILSGGAKVFLFFVLAFILDDFVAYPSSIFTSIFTVILTYILMFALMDMLLFKIKNCLILRCEGFSSFPYPWQVDIKSFLVELLKYTGIAIFLITLYLLGFINPTPTGTGIVSFFSDMGILWIMNIFLTFVVLLKKRHHHQLQAAILKEICCDEPINQTLEIETLTSRSYFKHRALAFGVLGVAFLYVLSLSIPYMAVSGSKPIKPSLEAFANRDEVQSFFVDHKLPFMAATSNTYSANMFTESLFMFNKMLIGFTNFDAGPPLMSSRVSKSDGAVNFNGSLNAPSFGKIVFTYTSKDTIPSGGASQKSHSTTNTQVEHVDEADVIKTDGKYVYYLNGSELFIVQAHPAEEMNILYQQDYGNEGLFPVELFLYKQHLAVVFRNNKDYPYETMCGDTTEETMVRTYNIQDPSNPVLERNLKLDSSYLTSRMVENHMYLVATSLLNNDNKAASSPKYIDSARSDLAVEIDYRNLYFMRGNSNDNYLSMNTAIAFPVDEPSKESQVKAYIGGGGENVYVSNEHIYIAESTVNARIESPLRDFIDHLTMADPYELDFEKYGINIYRLKIQNGTIGGFDSAFIPGSVHNQFSMDEYNGYFRLATQTGHWRYASSNVYILDKDMDLCGELEGLAPEEHIYSARFMGDRLYLVTFKQVDPLFVIDLKDPQHPKVLGKLKIPGYSDYLHPLDENHIVGFGKDTAGGNENFSWQQGMKMALFDVTDVKNPKEKFVEIIGDRGTDSELLRNHKALMYMKDLGLMAFPVTVAKRVEKSPDHEYGKVVFQGAYVYHVNPTEGFTLRGKITHLDPQSKDISFNPYDTYTTSSRAFINRILYANESLYTFSGEKVKATRYSDMQDVGEIDLR